MKVENAEAFDVVISSSILEEEELGKIMVIGALLTSEVKQGYIWIIQRNSFFNFNNIDDDCVAEAGDSVLIRNKGTDLDKLVSELILAQFKVKEVKKLNLDVKFLFKDKGVISEK